MIRSRSATEDGAAGAPVAPAPGETVRAERVAAPFAGVATVLVREGDSVLRGQPIASIEAMKMEAAIAAPAAGRVQQLAFADHAHVQGGDLIALIAPA
ncbi:biotin/lipoyl-binding protein [Luteipulveratus sp. YIM 133132]|uniref:biotin/lipoyl-containing protein n=1 Tax=Luteipulveratus flavus TaxID=3031728 RepID=UPI0023B15152|nr:biotin/lipoyl-containing protein [Luteipulveratus sp. YIM 133132]MDE9367774.1 biotin/lipoyl-binding protein [Luteipulveratus sp. YIM 133132]